MTLNLNDRPAGLIVYDLDLCLAPTQESIQRVLAEWALSYYTQRGETVDYDEAERRMLANFDKYHCSVTGVAVDHGHPPSWVAEIYEHVSHKTASMFVATHTPCPDLPVLMQHVAERMNYVQALATASSSTHAVPILTHIGAADFIPPPLRVDRNVTPGKSKRDKDPLNHVLGVLGDYVPDHKWFCEDTCAHFAPSTELGFTNVKIGDREEGDYARFVDYRYPTVQDFLRDLTNDKLTPCR